MIQFKEIQKTYDNGTKALKGIEFRIEDGEFVFLVGPSGSGKSTIVKLITAEEAPGAADGQRVQPEHHPPRTGALHAPEPGGDLSGLSAY